MREGGRGDGERPHADVYMVVSLRITSGTSPPLLPTLFVWMPCISSRASIRDTKLLNAKNSGKEKEASSSKVGHADDIRSLGRTLCSRPAVLLTSPGTSTHLALSTLLFRHQYHPSLTAVRHGVVCHSRVIVRLRLAALLQMQSCMALARCSV